MSAYRPVVAFRGEPGTKPPQGGFCDSPLMKVNVYIDGFNLYYGAVKGTPYRWLRRGVLARSQFANVLTDIRGSFSKPAGW